MQARSFAGNEWNIIHPDRRRGKLCNQSSPDKKDFSVVFMNNTRNEKEILYKKKDAGSGGRQFTSGETSTDNYRKYRGSRRENVCGKHAGPIQYPDGPRRWTTIQTEQKQGQRRKNFLFRRGVNTEKLGYWIRTVQESRVDVTDEYLYADNFEYEEEADDYLASRGNEPRYMLSDTHGAWIVEGGRLMQANDAIREPVERRIHPAFTDPYVELAAASIVRSGSTTKNNSKES